MNTLNWTIGHETSSLQKMKILLFYKP